MKEKELYNFMRYLALSHLLQSFKREASRKESPLLPIGLC